MNESILRISKALRKTVLIRDASKISQMNRADAAIKLASYNFEDQIIILNLIDSNKVALILKEMSTVNEEMQKQIINSMSIDSLKKIFVSLPSDDATDLIQLLAKKKMIGLFEVLPDTKINEIKKLLPYPETTAGGIMRKESLIINENNTVAEALEKVKTDIKFIGDKFSTVFVLNDEQRLVGMVNISKLLFADEQKIVSSIMYKEVISVHEYDDQEKVAEVFKKHDFYSIPVTDKDKKYMGVITVDDVLDVIEEEATQDILSLSGIRGDENIFDPWQISVRRRLPWLIVNLLTAFLAASVVSLFQKSIQTFVLLAVFMPVIAGMGGNAGTQTLGVTVRSIALGHMKAGDAKKVFIKELRAALANGFICGILASLMAYYFSLNPLLGLIVLFAMMINIIVAASAGALIPITLKKMNIDPATASSIFITTITDITGFIAFLGTATLLMNGLV